MMSTQGGSGVLTLTPRGVNPVKPSLRVGHGALPHPLVNETLRPLLDDAVVLRTRLCFLIGALISRAFDERRSFESKGA